ncbi:MAG: hypothetical protein FJZ01_11845 [Candidatus Sericytochromatia bacterium]|nr:hypothetical protein [Candidatus Tanganyikabacteria bacterium]
MTWSDFAGYFSDLVAMSCLAALAIYGWKLIAPQRFHDRFAGIALGLAFLGSGGALFGGLALGETPAWALFCWPLLGMFWWLESEFGTRILGMVAALATVAAQFFFPWDTAVPGTAVWATLTATGAILAGSFLTFALATWLLAGLYRFSSALNSRKTARFFVMNQPIVAELAYRLNTWALPFAVFAGATAAFGLAASQVPLPACVALLLACGCSAAYAVRARGQSAGVAVQLVWLLAGGLLLAWGYVALGLAVPLKAA